MTTASLCMNNFGEFVQRLAADSLGGRIGTGVLRILFFQLRQFMLERIQRRIGNFLPVQNMIKIAVTVYRPQSFWILFLDYTLNLCYLNFVTTVGVKFDEQ